MHKVNTQSTKVCLWPTTFLFVYFYFIHEVLLDLLSEITPCRLRGLYRCQGPNLGQSHDGHTQGKWLPTVLSLRPPRIWSTSQIWMSFLFKGHANFLCLFPTLEYVLLKRVLAWNVLILVHPTFWNISSEIAFFEKQNQLTQTTYLQLEISLYECHTIIFISSLCFGICHSNTNITLCTGSMLSF